MWRIARITAVSALLAMTVGAARADTVLPDNGSVEFYDSFGEATFNLLFTALPQSYLSWYFVSANFSLYDINGNLIYPPFVPFYPDNSLFLWAEAGYGCPLSKCGAVLSGSYPNLPDGYYTVDITSSAIFGDLLSPLTYTLTGDVTPDPPSTPLPATLPLFAIGLVTLGLFGWHRKRVIFYTARS